MVHLLPLPGSPAFNAPLDAIVGRACDDALALERAGFDAILVENFGDAPFRAERVDPHTVAAMTVIARAVRQTTPLPVGINVLRNDARAAMAVAVVCQAAFIRVNVHTGVYATDQGIIEGRADRTLRYRRELTGVAAPPAGLPPPPAVFADVHVKHASPLLRQSIADAAEEAAHRGHADALIVSGTGTGKPTDPGDLEAVRRAVPDRPVIIGSGATPDNIRQLLTVADGAIVGTAIKDDAVTTAPVNPERAAAFVEAARS